MTAGAEVDVDEALVRALLADQHPDLADRSLALIGEGWDNRVFRLGDDLTVRLPVRAVAAPLIEHELRWLPGLVAGLPASAVDGLRTSAPVRAGVSGRGYPWAWSVGPWLPGQALVDATLDDPVGDATRLGRFLRAFHRPAPPDAPANAYRGVPLADRVPLLQNHLDDLAPRGRSLPPGVRADDVVARLGELATTSRWTGPDLWLHGDPHVLNLLVDGGRLTGVIDFGDLTSGDPASDLIPRWLVFDPSDPDGAAAGTAFVEAIGVDDDTWRRAEGWAIAMAVAYVSQSLDGSPFIELGRSRLAWLMGA